MKTLSKKQLVYLYRAQQKKAASGKGLRDLLNLLIMRRNEPLPIPNHNKRL